ncbi:MAG: hypothetical protein IJ371_00140 [Clostridia bacterium]|nr:hypothetical protein [Clostridia bacterium]
MSNTRFDKFWTGDKFKSLAPSVKIIKINEEKFYTELYYENVLNKLNP